MNGAGKLRTIFTVTFPLLRPALLSAWTLLFVFATREVNEAVILSGPRSRPLSVLAWNYVEQGSIRNAAVVVRNGLKFQRKWRHIFSHEDGPPDEACRWRKLDT